MSVLFTKRGTPPSFGKKASDYAVGESVYLLENGAYVEYLVVHQGLPDTTSYDASCNGTWLLRKDIYEKRAWDTTNNDYANSDIHAYLNGTFLGIFDSNVQSTIKQVKIPYVSGTGKGGTLASGASGLSSKVFLLSVREVGFSGNVNNYTTFPDGATLGYFNGTATTDTKRIGYYNGTATIWYLRSPHTGNIRDVICGQTSGACGAYTYGNSYGIRPAIIINSDTKFNADTNVIE